MTIKVGFYAVDDRSIQRYLTVFKMVYKGQCTAVDTPAADTVIIELDPNDYQATWNTFRKAYPTKPVVIMADSPITIDGYPFVSKPAKLPELLEALKQTGQAGANHLLNVGSGNKSYESADALNKHIRGEGEPAHKKPAATQDIYYQPEKFLQGRVAAAIQQANSTNKSVFVRCWSSRWIIVCPRVDCLYENIKEGVLGKLSKVEIVDSDLAFYPEPLANKQIGDMAGVPLNEIKTTPIYQFVWDLAARTSNGRIPQGTSLDDRYVLQQWPNLPRLAAIPHAMRISAFWIDQPYSLNEVTENLGIPVVDIYTYFSAALATGLMTRAESQPVKELKPQPAQQDTKEQKKMTGVLSAIMRKIGRKIKIEENAA